MPEGPDVRQNIDFIKEQIGNFTLTSIKILGGKYSRQITLDNCQSFNKSLPSKCKVFTNKGKFAYIILENGWSIWLSFGMTGFLTLNKDEKHNNIQFITQNPKNTFFFNDQRNFGTIKLEPNLTDLEKKLSTLGPDPLITKKNYKYFIETLDSMNPNEEISVALLNQGLLAGVGNYVRAEALYRAKLNPFKKLKDLTDNEIKKLLDAIYYILKKVYKERPKRKDDKPRPFKFQVYERKEDDNGNPVIWQKQPKIGRTIYYIKNQVV